MCSRLDWPVHGEHLLSSADPPAGQQDHPQDPRSIVLGGSQASDASLRTIFGWGEDSAHMPLYWLALAASILVVFLLVFTLLLLLRKRCASKSGKKGGGGFAPLLAMEKS